MKRAKPLILITLLTISLNALGADSYQAPIGDKSDLGFIAGTQAVSTTSKAEPVYVIAVDGQIVENGETNWSKELALSPGKHWIAIALKGVYQEFPVDVCAGCTFRANAEFSEVKKTFVKLMNSELWITQEPTGSLVSEKQPGKPIPVKATIIFTRY